MATATSPGDLLRAQMEAQLIAGILGNTAMLLTSNDRALGLTLNAALADIAGPSWTKWATMYQSLKAAGV